MATGILMPGAVVANPIDIIPPAIANLSLWAYLGTDIAHSPNAGSAGALSNVSAGPTWSPHYASMKGIAGALQLPPFTASGNETFMCASRYMAGGTTGGAGNLLAPTSGSLGLNVSQTTTALNFAANGVTGAVPLALTAGGNWKFFAVTTQPGGPHTLYNLTDNTSQVAAATGTTNTAAGIAFGIGCSPGSTNDRGVDMAFAAWAMTTLTKPQIDAQYAAVKSTLAQFGIVV